MIHPNAKPICLPGSSDVEVLIFHGYTGSPSYFKGMATELNKRFGATVSVPLLPGHGTKIEDLDHVKYRHLRRFADHEAKRVLRSGKKLVVGGFSLGGQLALWLAGRYPVSAVFTVSLPYRLRFPFNVPGVWIIGKFKKLWPKIISAAEKDLKENFHYYHMPSYTLEIMRHANSDVARALRRIKTPCLSVFGESDPVSSRTETIDALDQYLKTPVHEHFIIEGSKNHNIFYPHTQKITDAVADFLARHVVFSENKVSDRIEIPRD